MQHEKVVYTPIGAVASSFNEPGDPKAMRNAESALILDEKYTGALDGLDRYKFILVIYHILWETNQSPSAACWLPGAPAGPILLGSLWRRS